MSIVLSASVVVFGVLVLLLLGAQVEMYRSLEQLRQQTGLVDQPKPLEVPRPGEARPSEYGLPAYLDSASHAVVLFLSDKCNTCLSIAAGLDGAVPKDVVLVMHASGGANSDLISGLDLDSDRTLVDPENDIGTGLGLTITPAAVVVENGVLARASTVPSSRQFYVLLDSVRSLSPVSGRPVGSTSNDLVTVRS